jgi:hypothetical protein
LVIHLNPKPKTKYLSIVLVQLRKWPLFFYLMWHVCWFMNSFLEFNKLLEVFYFLAFYFVGLGWFVVFLDVVFFLRATCIILGIVL